MKKLLTLIAAGAVAMSASAAASFSNYTSSPNENEAQSEISAITITFTDFEDMDINDSEGIYMVNGETYDMVDGSVSIKPYGSNNLVFTPEEPITEAGTYVLCVGEAMLCGYYGDEMMPLDNPEDMFFTYTVEGEVQTDKFAYTAIPESGMSMSKLSEVTVTFSELSRINIMDPSLVTVTLNQETLESVNYDIANGENGNELKITFSPEIVSEGTEIAVIITFDPGSLSGIKDGSASDNTEAIELRYLISEPVKYDLTVDFNSPTKPNAEGEISAEKQLTSFFFVSDVAGLVAAGGDVENVTIREVNGDFTKSGRIRKAFGMSQDKSYFSVEFNSEPSYNGEYEIVISQGAFGDEQWVVNPETGHSNMEQTLRFTLVDGAERVSYTIEPASVTPEETTVDSGDKLAVFTITFDTDVTLAADAYATLAGIDADFNESAAISASDDNRTFTVTFDTTPTVNGNYRFNIGKGAFVGEGDNKSVEIMREYKIDDTVGVNEIGTENGEVEIFNLQGVRVSGKNLPAGIYIVNGKKVQL